jgi:hypothetical protein
MQGTRRCVKIVDPDTGESGFWITGIPEQGYVDIDCSKTSMVHRISVLLTLSLLQ